MVAFSKNLKSTDVRSRFSWPAANLHLLPPFGGGDRVHFTAVDASGIAWAFTCSIRTRGPYLKPVLTASSWLPFVRHKALAVDDLVVFNYEPMAGFAIRVRKLKTVKLMGRYITAYANED